jgi:DNA (cytosine-5)-methyltransferase 1
VIQLTNKRPIAVDLFAGAGGISLGVEQAGFDTVFAIDNDPIATATLNLNRERFFPKLPRIEPQDLTQVDPREVMREIGIDSGDLNLLVGGPPCVAFSKSGFHLEYKREGKDIRANLLDDYLRFLEAMRPQAYMMENVFGLAYRNQSAAFFDRLTSGIRALGYSLTYGVLNAADYGVPQNRQRLFLIGSRDGRKLRLPLPTHWGEHERRSKPAGADRLTPHVTVADALKGLETEAEPEESVNGKYGHLLSEIPPGRNYLYFTEREGHPNPQFEWRSRYWTFLLKLDPNRPSSTIQSQPGPYVGPFHWENRRLRVPELKRLQGFPDRYEVAGNRRQIQVQVGNSVPPPLSFAVASAIVTQLERRDSGLMDEEPIQLSLISA